MRSCGPAVRPGRSATKATGCSPKTDGRDVRLRHAADVRQPGVDGLLLGEGPARGSGLIHPDAYRSVLNVADHYGWPVLIRADAAVAWPHGGIAGVVAGAGFWDGDNPAPDAEVVLVPVCAQADPEAVMNRVRALS